MFAAFFCACCARKCGFGAAGSVAEALCPGQKEGLVRGCVEVSSWLAALCLGLKMGLRRGWRGHPGEGRAVWLGREDVLPRKTQCAAYAIAPRSDARRSVLHQSSHRGAFLGMGRSRWAGIASAPCFRLGLLALSPAWQVAAGADGYTSLAPSTCAPRRKSAAGIFFLPASCSSSRYT